MVLGIDRDLHVVAHDAGAATARCHRAAVRVGQRYLLIWRSQHLLLHRREALHLAFELGELLLEVCRLGRKRLRRLLQIGRVELAQIPRDARLELRPAPLHFRARKVAVAIVDGLELAPVDGDARFGEQTHVAAQRDELGAHLADRRPIVLAEIGNRFVIRDQSAEKPDHLEIATGLTLQPPARLHPIEIAVDVELEQGRGMIRGPARYFRHNAFEPELAQIKRIDERIDRANRIALINPFIQAFGQQSRLPAIRPNQEALHRFPPQIARRIITSRTFSRSQGHSRPGRAR